MGSRFKIRKSIRLALAIGLVAGVVIMLAIRFLTYQPEKVHYHANFGLYINGQRETFKGSQYYQSVAICSNTSGITTPEQRAHMHNNVNDVVHVHDHAVTWGQFFENLGWYIGPDFIETASGQLYHANGNDQLHIMLNGQDYTGLSSITDMLIKDQSRLLISFGNISPAELQREYQTVASSAKAFDEGQDPAACSGADKVTTAERWHHLF